MDGGSTNVGVLCADGANHRERFSVDLIPGRTNIISLKKLRREAGEAVSDDFSDENENEAEKYIFVKLPRKKSSRAIAKKSSRAIAIRENVQPNYQSRSKLHAGKSRSFKSSADHELHSQSSMRTSTKQQSEIGRNEQPCQIYPCTGHAQKILREMILEDLYASQNFKQIKMEFFRLMRLHAPSFKAKVPAPGLTKGTYSIGDHLEDRLCDLYNTFIQGLDEDSGPLVVRRLFAKLADFFPKGTMDMHEIREAIFLAKEPRVLPSRQ